MRTPILKVYFSGPGRGYDSGKYYHVYVDVEVHDADNDQDDRPSPPTSSYRSDSEFHRVHLTNQTHGEKLGDPACLNTLDPFYAVKIQWSDGDLDLRCYEEGVKALRKIDRHLDRLQKMAGSPKSFGEFVYRLGKAMNIRRAYVPRPDILNHYVDLDHAGTLIDRQIGEWMAQWRPNHTAVTGVA